MLEGKANKQVRVNERSPWLCSVRQEWLINKLEKELLAAGYFKTGSPEEFRAGALKRIEGAAYRADLKHTQKKHAGKYIETLKSVIDRLNKEED